MDGINRSKYLTQNIPFFSIRNIFIIPSNRSKHLEGAQGRIGEPK